MPATTQSYNPALPNRNNKWLDPTPTNNHNLQPSQLHQPTHHHKP
jgi:hypothetical protein